MTKLLFIATITLSALTLSCTEGKVKAAQHNQKPTEKAVPIGVANAKIGDAVSTYSTTSTLEPEQRAEIRARSTGVIRRITVEEGDRVEQDQIILNLEDDDQQLRLKQAQIRLLQAEAEHARRLKMKAVGVLSEEDFEMTENELQQAKAELELAELAVSYTQVKAPFPGKIVLRHVDLGANVSPGTPLFELMDFEPLLVKIHIPSERLGFVKRGQPLALYRSHSTQRIEAEVRLVSPIVDPNTGTVKVTAEIHDYPPDTRPGDFVQADVLTDKRSNAVLVPSVAIIDEQGRKVLFVIEADRAIKREIETGYVDDEFTEIITGAGRSDLIVVKGQRNLRDGSLVEILEGPKTDRTEEASF